MPTNRRLSLKEAAEQLGVTERTVRNFISRGQLRAYRVGTKAVRIDQGDLDDLLRPIPTASAREAS